VDWSARLAGFASASKVPRIMIGRCAVYNGSDLARSSTCPLCFIVGAWQMKAQRRAPQQHRMRRKMLAAQYRNTSTEQELQPRLRRIMACTYKPNTRFRQSDRWFPLLSQHEIKCRVSRNVSRAFSRKQSIDTT